MNPGGGGGRGGGDTPYVGRYVMLGIHGLFLKFFCTFSARWVPFFNKISVFFLQGEYLF